MSAAISKAVGVGQSAFRSCRTIEELILPSTLQTISKEAFAYCYGLNKIVCKSVEVPNVLSAAFDGVPKDNFNVEVPQQSVTRYQSDSQWGEFRRITSHYEFALSRNLCRGLNNSVPKTYVLRAPTGMSWHVSQKPSWVSVYPETGTGKQEVTIVFNTMKAAEATESFREGASDENGQWYEYGASYRKGELVFTLDEVDYTAKMDLEQYNYAYQDGDVITLNKATKGKGVNVVFMGDCYDAKDMSKTLVVLVENSAVYAGICYLWSDNSAIAVVPVSTEAYPFDFRGLMQHEAGGHGFGKLLDEYIYHSEFISGCNCTCCGHVDEFMWWKNLGWGRNLELSGNMSEVGWSHLIFHPKYSNVVDIYEGGYMHARGVFRSEAVSCMNNNIPYYSAISRQAIVERIMDYAGCEFNLEEFIAKDVMTMGTITKSALNELVVPVTEPASHMMPVVLDGTPLTNPLSPKTK